MSVWLRCVQKCPIVRSIGVCEFCADEGDDYFCPICTGVE